MLFYDRFSFCPRDRVAAQPLRRFFLESRSTTFSCRIAQLLIFFFQLWDFFKRGFVFPTDTNRIFGLWSNFLTSLTSLSLARARLQWNNGVELVSNRRKRRRTRKKNILLERASPNRNLPTDLFLFSGQQLSNQQRSEGIALCRLPRPLGGICASLI